jgi:hypothetical protein
MINLLPPDLKSSYAYARRNVTLRRWLLICAVALVGIAGITTFGLASIQQSTNQYEKQIAASEATLKAEQYTLTQQRVKDMGNNFQLAVKVLSQEILFSQLLKQIGTIMPAKSSLTDLTISQTTGGLDITADAADYTTATQVQVNLADPNNKIFSKADLVSIVCDSKSAIPKPYPCTVSIRALFGPDNPYLFINSQGTKQ